MSVAVAEIAIVKPRRARLTDAHGIYDLVNHFADREEMLHGTIPEICENIRDYLVVESEGRIAACAGLHINLDTLAEIKSLAVREDLQGRGLGATLVRQCLDEALQLGVPTVFALTYSPAFFERLGFHRAPKSHLPRKVWGECIRCPKFPDCGEIAVMKDLPPPGDFLILPA